MKLQLLSLLNFIVESFLELLILLLEVNVAGLQGSALNLALNTTKTRRFSIF